MARQLVKLQSSVGKEEPVEGRELESLSHTILSGLGAHSEVQAGEARRRHSHLPDMPTAAGPFCMPGGDSHDKQEKAPDEDSQALINLLLEQLGQQKFEKLNMPSPSVEVPAEVAAAALRPAANSRARL